MSNIRAHLASLKNNPSSALPYSIEDVEAFGGKVKLRGFSAAERVAYQEWAAEQYKAAQEAGKPAPSGENLKRLLLTQVLDPQDDSRVFGDEWADQLLQLFPFDLLDGLAVKVLKLSGLAPKAEEDAGKSLPPTEPGASSSTLPTDTENPQPKS